eukprot:g24922.t1
MKMEAVQIRALIGRGGETVQDDRRSTKPNAQGSRPWACWERGSSRTREEVEMVVLNDVWGDRQQPPSAPTQEIRRNSGSEVKIDHQPSEPLGTVTIIGDLAKTEQMIHDALVAKGCPIGAPPKGGGGGGGGGGSNATGGTPGTPREIPIPHDLVGGLIGPDAPLSSGRTGISSRPPDHLTATAVMKGLIAAAVPFLASAYHCPGSASTIHASCKVTVTANAPCEQVKTEMMARVDGQYTDQMLFDFVDSGNSCEISGCSESQVFSIADFSTNYCNLRMLYCGSADGCKPVKFDFTSQETQVDPSPGAGHDQSACLKTSEAQGFLATTSSCPPKDFETVKDFDLDSFISKRWYIQQQMPVKYLPASQNRCVYAEYQLQKKSFWGYDAWRDDVHVSQDVSVHNHAEEVAAPHTAHDSGKTLCAKVVDKSRGKLEVAPCFLPTALAGPYWVLDYNEAEGYALISGGAPKEAAEGGCRTGTGLLLGYAPPWRWSVSQGTNGSGLWIFTRQQKRDEALVQKVRSIAQQKGFDLSVLNDAGGQVNISVLQANSPGGPQICRITGPEDPALTTDDVGGNGESAAEAAEPHEKGHRPSAMALSQVKYLDAVPITTERVYEGLSLVTVELAAWEGDRIPVKIDPVYGPQPYKVGGAEPGPHDSVRLPMMAGENAPSGTHKKWSECTSTEQQLAAPHR